MKIIIIGTMIYLTLYKIIIYKNIKLFIKM